MNVYRSDIKFTHHKLPWLSIWPNTLRIGFSRPVTLSDSWVLPLIYKFDCWRRGVTPGAPRWATDDNG